MHNPTVLAERRQLILAAAVEEFARYGYEGASTNRIARKARVAKGLIFRYFESKQGLFEAALDDACDRIFAPLDERLPRDPFQRLEEFVVQRALRIRSHPDCARLVGQFRSQRRRVLSGPSRRVDKAYEPLRAAFKEGAEICAFRDDLESGAALHLLSLVAEGLEGKLLRGLERAVGHQEAPSAFSLDPCVVRERARIFANMLKKGIYQAEVATHPQPLRAWDPEAFIALSAQLAPRQKGGDGDQRRDRILQAAQALFAERGYEGTSAEAIASQAGVAKGLIFHYFGSKAELYLVAVADAATRISQVFFADLPEPEPDLFRRMYAWMQRKVEIFRAQPVYFQLVMSAFTDPPAAARAAIDQYMAEGLEMGWTLMLDGIDTAPFRPDVPPDQAMELVITVADVLSDRALVQMSDQLDRGPDELRRVLQQAETFLEMLRDGLCPS